MEVQGLVPPPPPRSRAPSHAGHSRHELPGSRDPARPDYKSFLKTPSTQSSPLPHPSTARPRAGQPPGARRTGAAVLNLHSPLSLLPIFPSPLGYLYLELSQHAAETPCVPRALPSAPNCTESQTGGHGQGGSCRQRAACAETPTRAYKPCLT